MKRPSKKPKKEFGKPGQKHDEPPFVRISRASVEVCYSDEHVCSWTV